MKATKSLFLSMAVFSIGFISAPSPAQAGVFNGAISNPFVFCSMPKPCKRCQPFRRIWESICPAGQPSAEAKKQYEQSIASDPQSAKTAINPEDFKSKLTPSIMSAYNDAISPTEVDQYIDWLGKQKAPNNFNGTMGEYWNSQGVYDFSNNATIRNAATNVIDQTNQNIVKSVSGGTIPQEMKPWFQ